MRGSRREIARFGKLLAQTKGIAVTSTKKIDCSRIADRKRDLLWVERFFRRHGTDVSLTKDYPGAPWVVRGSLSILALAKFVCEEAQRESRV